MSSGESFRWMFAYLRAPVVMTLLFSSFSDMLHLKQEPVELAQEFRKFDLAAPWEQFPAFREMIPAAEEIPIDEKK